MMPPNGVSLTPLRVIDVAGGNVMHALKQHEDSFCGFGEAYFSVVEQHGVKAWKRHREMTLNLCVPVGRVRFVVYDDRPGSATYDHFFSVLIGPVNYQRLTIAPGLWAGFQGMDTGLNLVLNIADIPHDPDEADRTDKTSFSYDWDDVGAL